MICTNGLGFRFGKLGVKDTYLRFSLPSIESDLVKPIMFTLVSSPEMKYRIIGVDLILPSHVSANLANGIRHQSFLNGVLLTLRHIPKPRAGPVRMLLSPSG